MRTTVSSGGKPDPEVTQGGKLKETPWGYHWPVMIAVIIASILNWWIGYLIFSRYTICGLDWLDTVGTYLWSLWWVFAFVVWGYWPFTKIKNWWARGITMVIVSWILGVLCWWIASLIVNLQVYGFPILAGLFFWIVMTDFAFDLWAKQPPPKKAALDLIFWYTVVIICIFALPKPGLIPAWWFVPAQWLLGSGIWAYWTRNMRKSEAGIAFWVLCAFLVFLAVGFATLLGFFKFDLAHPYQSLISGYSLYFLIWFGAGCSFTWSVFTIFECWPWRKIKPPTLGAILGFICVLFIHVATILISLAVCKMIWPPKGPHDVYYMLQAFALAYAGVNWGFTIPLCFPSRRTGFPPQWSWED